MKTISIRLDVTRVTGFEEPQYVAGKVFLPEQVASGTPVVIFAAPGGGYSKEYFDMHFPGHSGYSEAEYHTARGLIFVAIDHLGVGESSTNRLDDLTPETIAAGNDAFVREITRQLVSGELADDLPPTAEPFLVGAGQSMGGGITMVMQAIHRTYDALVLLGVSAIHTVIPQPTQEQFLAARQLLLFSRHTPLDQLSVKEVGSHVPDFLYPFHWHTEPKELIDADLSGGIGPRTTAPPFGSLTIPRWAVAMNSPAYFTADAAQIDVPVLIVSGERDVYPEVRREPTAFFNSNDVSVFVVPEMAHMHNFANTRQVLWRRTADWSVMQNSATSAVVDLETIA